MEKPRIQRRYVLGQPGWGVYMSGRLIEWYADWRDAAAGALTLCSRLKMCEKISADLRFGKNTLVRR